LTDEARDALLAYAWPGNVRELRNVLERAAILSDDGVIERRHLSLQDPSALSAVSSTDLSAMERHRIETVLRETDGNKSKTARRLGISRTQLYVRLRRYGLDDPFER
jgi:transcriptional regulator of acetoin/glycerol metabolism